jgi:hypothetical protein
MQNAKDIQAQADLVLQGLAVVFILGRGAAHTQALEAVLIQALEAELMLVLGAGPTQVLEEDSLPDQEVVFTKVRAGERIEVLAVAHTKVQGGHARPALAGPTAIRGTGRRLHANNELI